MSDLSTEPHVVRVPEDQLDSYKDSQLAILREASAKLGEKLLVVNGLPAVAVDESDLQHLRELSDEIGKRIKNYCGAVARANGNYVGCSTDPLPLEAYKLSGGHTE